MTHSLRRILLGRSIDNQTAVKRLVLGFLVIAAFYFPCRAALSLLVLNPTDSIGSHLMLKTPWSEIAPGDLVFVPVNHPLVPENSLAKYALCWSGDHLKFADGAFYCNGFRLNSVKPFTKQGEPLTPFHWTEAVIPEGFIFIGSSHPDGFDSRYIGLIPVENATRLEHLL